MTNKFLWVFFSILDHYHFYISLFGKLNKMSFIPELIDQKDETTVPETDGHALRKLKIAEAIS